MINLNLGRKEPEKAKCMAGAAVIGQIVSAILLMLYFPRFQTVKFEAKDFLPKGKCMIQICRLGFASVIFQSSMLIVQVVLNETDINPQQSRGE